MSTKREPKYAIPYHIILSFQPAAWRIPLALQLVPAIILGIGILFMPFSPRWLINVGREDEALTVLSNSRRLPRESELVQIEFLYAFLSSYALFA